MLDGFLGTRRAIFYWSQRRRHIPDKIFKQALELAAQHIPHPDRTILNGSQSKGFISQFYGLHLRGKTPYAKQPDRSLLEVIVLHKWFLDVQHLQCEQGIALRAGIGTMMQRKLTLLLLELNLNQWNRIYKLGRARGLSERQWRINIAGASAAAYTIMALCKRQNATVLLPSAHEDVVHGIDVFWLEGNFSMAVSVKARVDVSRVRAWWIDSEPKGRNLQGLERERARIARGARNCSNEQAREGTPRRFEPILVHVGKERGKPIRLNLCRQRTTWPETLLDQIHAARLRAPLRGTGT